RWSWSVAPAPGSSASACAGSSPRCSRGASTPRWRPTTPALAPHAARRGTPRGRRAAMRRWAETRAYNLAPPGPERRDGRDREATDAGHSRGGEAARPGQGAAGGNPRQEGRRHPPDEGHPGQGGQGDARDDPAGEDRSGEERGTGEERGAGEGDGARPEVGPA